MCFHQHRHEHGAEGEKQAPRGEGESSLARYANQQDPKPQMSHDLQSEGRVGRGLSRANTAKQEGLCQFSDDVIMYFEEVMSGLCSDGVPSGTTLVRIS